MRKLFIYIFTLILLATCSKNPSFKKISPGKSGIQFFNELIENDTLNYTIFPYMYMGGGVSVGDINNDGLDDIFFTGNLVPNKLYLNKGNFEFEDISEKAGIEGVGQWFTGSTMADVNNDGWLDIYVCVSAKYQPTDNLLFINNQDNTFTESAKEYGINDKSASIQATFFDYNNDGLLDLFVANYPIVLVSMGAEFYNNKMIEKKYDESGHLYKNNGNGTFTDVTNEAGVRNFGMSIGVVAMDFNNDGWKDLYISNDFNPPDFFYLNNGNGTFREIVKESTSQTSIFGMGFDAADFNNDELLDMFQIDMTPEDHFRRITTVRPMRQETFDKSLDFGFHYQYMQNSLQLNNGIFNNIPVYSNITLFAGVAYTDWSWGGVFLDMDNDGNKDLFVANGVLKDINDMDVLDDSKNIYFRSQEEYRPELFPSTPVKNYVFRNNGDLTFSNKSDDWGFSEPTLSNGMSFGDFDNDGDLDIVISNANKLSYVYENKTANKSSHYLKIKFKGSENNLFGIGSIVKIKTGEVTQMQELTLTRGYQSSMPPVIHFGLGNNETIDRLTVIWPDRKQQIVENVNCDQTLVLDYKDASLVKNDSVNENRFFNDITEVTGIDFIHKEDDFNDYLYEPLLPHKNSHMGPALAVGDVNNDGLEDFFIGNASGSASAMYIQTSNSTFRKIDGPWINDSIYEDTGALLFDANNDGKTDLYVASGGNEKNKKYTGRLYVNTSAGFTKTENWINGDINQSGKCVKAADFDKDGDLDLFIGGRINPGKYPSPANSYILKNNSIPGSDVKFENVTTNIAPQLLEMGLVTDAIWTDFDNDNDLDLIVVGEWMSIHFFENNSNKFTDVSEKLGMNETMGWWFSIFNTDIDNDGDEDFIVGNLGLNYKYKSTKENPFDIYYNDFDVNGQNDIVLSYSENGISYPVRGLNASAKQIPVIKIRYETHEAYASATLEDIYGKQMLESSLHYRINTFAHYWIENKGNGKFDMHILPNLTQFSSVNDISVIKYNNSAAFVIAGNLYNSEVETPRNDASIGLVITNINGELKAIPPAESNLIIKGEVKAIEKIKLANGKNSLLFGINNDSLRLIEYH